MRPRILVVQDYYLPGEKCGGPVWTVAHLVERLGHRFEFFIAALNRDSNSTVPYAGISPNTWRSVGKASVFYSSKPSLRTLRLLIRKVAPHALYLNGFFNRLSIKVIAASHWDPRFRIPMVLAPHGEFSKGALRWKSARKRAYVSLVRSSPFYGNVMWHASSAHEAEDIHKNMGESCRVHIAPDLAPPLHALPSPRTPRPAKSPGDVRLVYLGRVTPHKNLCWAIEMIGSASGVSLDIFGPVDDQNYWAKCKQAIANLPAQTRVRYYGSVPHEKVFETLSSSHFFLLPTFGENFGHAILEAMLAGCPVLISDTTPWRNLADHGAGWDLPLKDRESWLVALRQAVAMNQATYSSYSNAAREFAINWIRSPDRELQMVELFRQALDTHPAPRVAAATKK